MKQPVTTWSREIDGKRYEFSHTRQKGRQVISVNGKPIEVKGGFMSALLGFDEPFTFDGKEARLVIGRTPDVAIYGSYLQSGKAYVRRPGWVLAFAILNLLIPIVSLGGALPIALGFIGLALCVSISKAAVPLFGRVVLCLVITGAAWAAWYFLVQLVASL